jgi:hypothetical protein
MREVSPMGGLISDEQRNRILRTEAEYLFQPVLSASCTSLWRVLPPIPRRNESSRWNPCSDTSPVGSRESAGRSVEEPFDDLPRE